MGHKGVPHSSSSSRTCHPCHPPLCCDVVPRTQRIPSQASPVAVSLVAEADQPTSAPASTPTKAIRFLAHDIILSTSLTLFAILERSSSEPHPGRTYGCHGRRSICVSWRMGKHFFSLPFILIHQVYNKRKRNARARHQWRHDP